MSEKITKVPAIRFKGFTDPWEQRKLSDVAEIVGGGTPSTSNPEYWDGDIDWYAPAEIGEQIYVSKSHKTITKLGQQKSSAKILPVGTVLFTSRAGIGNTAILAKEGATNQGFQSIVSHENELDSYFIFSRTHELKRYGELTGAGSTFVEVSGKQMAKMPILIPNIDEQRKIGSFFEQIDATITLHQRELDLMKKQKQTLLSKMFPKTGEQFPEIRFKGFTDPWEQRKVSEVTKMYDNLRVPVTAIDRVAGDTPYYGANGIQDYVDGFTHEGEFVLVAEDGANDLINYPVQYVFGKIWVNNHAHILQGNQKILDNLFLASRIRSMNISTYLVGGGRAKLNGDVLKKLPITIPEYEEQIRIGRFLQIIETTITLQQRKLDQMKIMKKSLLKAMFV